MIHTLIVSEQHCMLVHRGRIVLPDGGLKARRCDAQTLVAGAHISLGVEPLALLHRAEHGKCFAATCFTHCL